MSLAVERAAPPAGGLARRAFRVGTTVWTSHIARLAATTAVIWVPVYLLQLLLAPVLDVPARSRAIATAAQGGGDAGTLTAAALVLAGYSLFSLLLLFVALPMSHGALIASIGCYERGAPCRLADCYRLALERFWPFLGAMFLVALLILLAEAALLIVGLVLIALAYGNVALLTLMLLAGVAIPLLVAVPFSVAPQAVILEHARPFEALRRSRQLLAGRYLPMLALLIVLGVLGWAVTTVSGIPVRLSSAAGAGAQLTVSAVMAMLTAVVMTPLVVSVLTSAYFEARR